MKFVHVSLFLVVAYFTVLTQGLFRGRRQDTEIKNRNGNTIHEKVGIPMVFNHDKKAYMRTGIPELRHPEDIDTTGDSTFHDDDEEMDTDEDSGVSETGDSKDDEGGDKDDDGDDEDKEGDDKDKDKHNDKNKKNPEELGEGYEKIEDMGSNNKDDDEDDKESKEAESSEEDIMSINSSKKPDLNGEFPPSADQLKNLPKDKELTTEQANRKLAEKRKGYVQFTIRQRFKPELKYKESAAYKILAGNVSEDVERALKATGVVRDVLFREAKDVGGPPYRSKVQVLLKLKNVSNKRLKRIVNYGLINDYVFRWSKNQEAPALFVPYQELSALVYTEFRVGRN